MKHIKQSCFFPVILLFMALFHCSALCSLGKAKGITRAAMSPFIDLQRNKGLSKFIPLGKVILFCMTGNAVVVTCLAIIAGSNNDSAYLRVKQKVHNVSLLQKILSMESMKKESAVYNEKDPLGHLSLLGKSVALANVYGNPLIHWFLPKSVSYDEKFKQEQLMIMKNKLDASVTKANSTGNFSVDSDIKEFISAFIGSFNKYNFFEPNKSIRELDPDETKLIQPMSGIIGDSNYESKIANSEKIIKENFSEILKKCIVAWMNKIDGTKSMQNNKFFQTIQTAQYQSAFAEAIAKSVSVSFVAIGTLGLINFWSWFNPKDVDPMSGFLVDVCMYMCNNLFSNNQAMASDNFREGSGWITVLTDFKNELTDEKVDKN